MSLYDYNIGLEITTKYGDDEFYGLIQACMRLADTNNLEKLKEAWPAVWDDYRERYNAPGGLLPEDTQPKNTIIVIEETKPTNEVPSIALPGKENASHG